MEILCDLESGYSFYGLLLPACCLAVIRLSLEFPLLRLTLFLTVVLILSGYDSMLLPVLPGRHTCLTACTLVFPVISALPPRLTRLMVWCLETTKRVV